MISTQVQRAIRDRASRVVVPQAIAAINRQLDQDVPRATGKLARSRRTSFRNAGDVLSATIEYPLPQAGWTDQGTRQHWIFPRRAKALRFRIGGQIVFARRVNHPGTKGTKWFTKNTTAQAWRDSLQGAAR